jgi:hypothetical protein
MSMGANLFSKTQEIAIRELSKGRSARELTKIVNAKFNRNLKVSQMKSWKVNHQANSGRNGQFKKGMTPWNKGKKTGNHGRMTETQFKSEPHLEDRKPLGTKVMRADGYIWIKINNDLPFKNRWKQLHRLIWEEHNGPIPKEKKLMFLDGDPTHVVIDNLALVSSRENLEMNRYGLNSKDPELTKTGINIAKVNIKLRERSKGKNA